MPRHSLRQRQTTVVGEVGATYVLPCGTDGCGAAGAATGRNPPKHIQTAPAMTRMAPYSAPARAGSGSCPGRRDAHALHARGNSNAESYLRSGRDAPLYPSVIGLSHLRRRLTRREGRLAPHQHPCGGERRKVRCRPGTVTGQNRACQQESRDRQHQDRRDQAEQDHGGRSSFIVRTSPDVRRRCHWCRFLIAAASFIAAGRMTREEPTRSSSHAATQGADPPRRGVGTPPTRGRGHRMCPPRPPRLTEQHGSQPGSPPRGCHPAMRREPQPAPHQHSGSGPRPAPKPPTTAPAPGRRQAARRQTRP